MGSVRAPFQGVGNIIRFNWGKYLLSSLAILALGLAACLVAKPWSIWCILALGAILIPSLVSVVVSYHIYDRSALYEFQWLDRLPTHELETIVSISAGFDETSPVLRSKYPTAVFHVLDFYDAKRHTEPSLRIARCSHPPTPDTVLVSSSNLAMTSGSVDKIFVIFSAHEIRDGEERTAFFLELRRILKPDGCLIVMEHLRGVANMLAYTIGSLHFHTRRTWQRAFVDAALTIHDEVACTPFVTTFILKKHGLPA
jgi:hypothetical protein